MHQLHREVGPAVGEGAQLVDRHDPRVLELAADLGLLDEAADQLGLVAVCLEQDLDGQVAAEVGVAALEDRPHAAAGDLAQDLVAVALLRRAGISSDGSWVMARPVSSAPVSGSSTRGIGPI